MYATICNKCGLLNIRTYSANCEKIALKHMSKKKYSEHVAKVYSYNSLVYSFKVREKLGKEKYTHEEYVTTLKLLLEQGLVNQ